MAIDGAYRQARFAGDGRHREIGETPGEDLRDRVEDGIAGLCRLSLAPGIGIAPGRSSQGGTNHDINYLVVSSSYFGATIDRDASRPYPEFWPSRCFRLALDSECFCQFLIVPRPPRWCRSLDRVRSPSAGGLKAAWTDPLPLRQPSSSSRPCWSVRPRTRAQPAASTIWPTRTRISA